METYKAIAWNRTSRIYDLALWLAIALYLAIFLAVAGATADSARSNPEILMIGALGACAFFLLHVVLAIGPLARLHPLFLPFLTNRRHLGVSLFLVALAHATFATLWYHGGGVIAPLVSLFVSNPRYDAIGAFPFESLGAAALLIFFLLAATSHDFWLRNLSPQVWKTLHMLVYAAYALVVLHVVLGAASGRGGSSLYLLVVAIGFAFIAGLHLAAAVVQLRRDGQARILIANGWIDAGRASDIPEKRARVIAPPTGEAIAVFNFDGKIAAVANLCPHQLGPLGEGEVIDGCIVCPWHARRYAPGEGKLTSYAVRVSHGRIFVAATPNAPGAKTEPTPIS